MVKSRRRDRDSPSDHHTGSARTETRRKPRTQTNRQDLPEDRVWKRMRCLSDRQASKQRRPCLLAETSAATGPPGTTSRRSSTARLDRGRIIWLCCCFETTRQDDKKDEQRRVARLHQRRDDAHKHIGRDTDERSNERSNDRSNDRTDLADLLQRPTDTATVCSVSHPALLCLWVRQERPCPLLSRQRGCRQLPNRRRHWQPNQPHQRHRHGRSHKTRRRQKDRHRTINWSWWNTDCGTVSVTSVARRSTNLTRTVISTR